jgi:hypothetical protein
MIVLAYGLPGMGKTLWMHDYIKASLPLGYRWLVVDHADEWSDPASPHWRGKAPPLTVFGPGDSHPDLEKPGVYVFSGWEGLAVGELATRVGNAVYVDDELDLVARKVGWDESPLRRIVHQGRHLRNSNGEISTCHILGACRRPQSLHTDVSEQALHVVMFRIQGMRTLERLRSDSHIEDEEWDIIRTMPKFRYREWPTGQYRDLEPIGPKEGEAEGAPNMAAPQNESGISFDAEDPFAAEEEQDEA